MLTSRGIGDIRIALNFDVTHEPLKYLSNIRIALISGRTDSHRWTRRTLVVRHLTNKLRKAINGQTRTLVLFSLRPNMLRPLLRGTEPQVFEHLLTQLRLRITDRPEPLLRQSKKLINRFSLFRCGIDRLFNIDLFNDALISTTSWIRHYCLTVGDTCSARFTSNLNACRYSSWVKPCPVQCSLAWEINSSSPPATIANKVGRST